MWGPSLLEYHSPQNFEAGYYWPILFSNLFTFVRACDKCQRFIGKQQLKYFPLRPIVVNGPFQQWGLDFIGEIHPSSGQHKWILVATEYFTKWIEAVPTRNATHQVIMRFLYEKIFIRFGCPVRLVTENAPAFKPGHWLACVSKWAFSWCIPLPITLKAMALLSHPIKS